MLNLLFFWLGTPKLNQYDADIGVLLVIRYLTIWVTAVDVLMASTVTSWYQSQLDSSSVASQGGVQEAFCTLPGITTLLFVMFVCLFNPGSCTVCIISCWQGMTKCGLKTLYGTAAQHSPVSTSPRQSLGWTLAEQTSSWYQKLPYKNITNCKSILVKMSSV